MGTFGVPIFSDSFSDLRARVFTFKKSGFQSFSDETKNAAISVKITLFWDFIHDFKGKVYVRNGSFCYLG